MTEQTTDLRDEVRRRYAAAAPAVHSAAQSSCCGVNTSDAVDARLRSETGSVAGSTTPLTEMHCRAGRRSQPWVRQPAGRGRPERRRRLGVSDVIAENRLSAQQRSERGSYAGCIAGALSISEYHNGLTAVGFTDITIIPSHQVADGMHSAIIRATKPRIATHDPPAPNTRIDAVNECRWLRPATGPISPPAKNPATPTVPRPVRTASTS